MRLLIATGTIALVSSVLVLGPRAQAQTTGTAAVGTAAVGAATVPAGSGIEPPRADRSGATAAVAPKGEDASYDLRSISKGIAEEASRLNDDAAARDRRLQELELDLKKNQQDIEAATKDADECLDVLRGAADLLAPDAQSRTVFRKQEAVIRDLASQAEANLDPQIRKTAPFFQQKSADLDALNRSAEETRTRLITHMDRLEKLRDRLKIERAGARVTEFVKGAQAYLGDMRTLAAGAQRLASDLDGFGRTAPEATKPAEATKPPKSRRHERSPAAAAAAPGTVVGARSQ